MSGLTKSDGYKNWILSVKKQIQASQIKASIAVNQQLIELYWFLGEQIAEKEKTASWGDGFLKQMSHDLLATFPDIKGFSYRNLKSIRQWYCFWYEAETIGKQLVSQLPWGHNILIIQKLNNPTDALFYIQKTIENSWSRSVLTHQIESGLHLRAGKAISNFEATLPKPESDLATQLLKDPYNFDFLMLTEQHNERELEDGLLQHLTKFLLELGAGFAFVGRQYKIEVDGEDFFVDLLFYHLRLRCYVVVELKVDKFKPEYAGKLNFYVSAIDSQVRLPEDRASIGILICKTKSNITVEYSLRDLNKPIGVSEYQIAQNLPEDLKSALPSIEQIEAELGGGDE